MTLKMMTQNVGTRRPGSSFVSEAKRWLDYRGVLIPEVRGGQDDDADALTSEDLDMIGELGKEGEGPGGDGTVPEWAQKIPDDGVKSAAAKFETEDAFFQALGLELTGDEDWRSGLPDEPEENEKISLKEIAGRFSSPADAMRAVRALQKREGQIRVPGKAATDDERKVYLKAVGVPESPDGYEFPAMPEGQELTDEIKANRATWAQRFHELSVPKPTALRLIELVAEDAVKFDAAQADIDKQFAKAQEERLRTEWQGDDFDKNHTLANRAFADLANRAGVPVDDLRKIETKDGRFLMDRAEMVRLFAVIGREMAEGGLGPTLTEAESERLDGELADVRKQIAEAQQKGDSKLANKLYQREMQLIAAQKGNQPIIGSQGRVV